MRLQAFTPPPDLKAKENKLEQLQKEKEAAINGQEFEKAAELRDQEQKMRAVLESLRETWKQQKGGENLEVDEESIAHITASWTGIPVKNWRRKNQKGC